MDEASFLKEGQASSALEPLRGEAMGAMTRLPGLGSEHRDGKWLTLGHTARQSPGDESLAHVSETFQNIHLSTRVGFPGLDTMNTWTDSFFTEGSAPCLTGLWRHPWPLPSMPGAPHRTQWRPHSACITPLFPHSPPCPGKPILWTGTLG